MAREFYSIEEDYQGRKRLFWLATAYCVDGQLKLEEASGCFVFLDDVSEWGLEEDLILALEESPHVIMDLNDDEYDAYITDYFDGAESFELPFDEVTIDTPCGNYFFDTED